MVSYVDVDLCMTSLAYVGLGCGLLGYVGVRLDWGGGRLG